MPDAVAILGIAPIAIPASDFTSTAWACRSGLPAWRIQNGTWEMIFEGDSEAQAVLSDWRYQGGPIAGYTGIVAPFGVHVGDSRADVQAVLGSYSDSSDIGSGDIYVYGSPVGPSGLRFEIPGATVVSFGVIDCQVGEGS